MQNIIGDKLCFYKNGVLEYSDTELIIKDRKIIGLYYSASYCPPCHKFTPILAQKYTALCDVEIIMVPSDKTEEAFEEYFEKMPWYSLPFDSKNKQELRDRYNVKSIPTLIFFDSKGNVIEREGRLLIQNNNIENVVKKLSAGL